MEDTGLAMARTLVVIVDRRLHEFRPALTAVASSPALAAGDLAAFHAQSREFLRAYPAALSLTLIDQTGLQVLNTAQPLDMPRVRARPELMTLFEQGDFKTTGVFLGPVVRKQVIAVGVPVRVDERTQFVVAAGISAAGFAEVLSAPGLSPSWTVSVIDADGRIVARRPHREDFIGQFATAELLRSLSERLEGPIHGRTKDGVPVLGAFSRSTQTGYSVAVGVPTEELMAPVRRITLIASSVVIFVMIASYFLARRISREIAHTIESLTEIAIGKRVASEPLPLGFHEAHRMRAGLSIHSVELQEAQGELEQLKEQTAAVDVADMTAVLNALEQPVVLANSEMEICVVNHAAEALFGYRQADLVGRSMRSLYRPIEIDPDGVGSIGRGISRDGISFALKLTSRVVVLSAGARYFVATFWKPS